MPSTLVAQAHKILQQSYIHARSIGHAADDCSLVAMGSEDVDCLLSLGLIHSEHHSYTHIVDVEHFAVSDLAMFLEETENRKDLPSAFIHVNALAFLEDARDVLVEAAAGDMRHSVHVAVADDVEDLFHINSGRGQCNFTEWFVAEFRIDCVKVQSRV